MGCSQSVPEDHPSMFKAKNVDDYDKTKNTVILEVKSQKLFVHSKQKRMMACWPIACLHRYGHNNDILMIETGHGCDTGQGLFLFKCNRAVYIFEKLKSVWGEIQEQHTRATSIAYPQHSVSMMTTTTSVPMTSSSYYNTTGSGSNALPLAGLTPLSNHPSTSTSHYTPPTPGTRGSASSHNTGISGPSINCSDRSLQQPFELQPAPIGREEMLHRRRINSTTVSYNRQNQSVRINHTRHHTVAADSQYENCDIINEHSRQPHVSYNIDSDNVTFPRESPEIPPRGVSANSLRSEGDHAPLTPGSNSTSGIGSLNGNSSTSEGKCNGAPVFTSATQPPPIPPIDPWRLQNGRKPGKYRKKMHHKFLRHPDLSPTLPMSARDYVNTANASLDVSGTPLPATAIGNGSHFNFDFDLNRLLHPNLNYAPIEVSTKNGDFYSCGASSASSGLGPGTPLTPKTPGMNYSTEYAEIDHHKTRALSHAFRSRQRERKSRHTSAETTGLMS